MTSILQTTSFGKWAILKGAHWWKINFFAKIGSKRKIATWNWSNPRCFPMEKIKALNSHALAHQCVHYEIITKLEHSHLEKGMAIIRDSHKIERGQIKPCAGPRDCKECQALSILDVCPYFCVVFFSWNLPPAIDLIQIITREGFFHFFFPLINSLKNSSVLPNSNPYFYSVLMAWIYSHSSTHLTPD